MVSEVLTVEEVRFPRQDSPPGPVVTYRLTPEELAEVCRRCPPVDEKVKRYWLLKKRLLAYARTLPEGERERFLWGLVGVRDV